MTLEGLVGRLTTFELSNFDNLKIENVEYVFKAKLSLKDPKDKRKKKVKHVSSDSDTNEDDVEDLEALIARIFHRGKGKYKVKLPVTCFNCSEVGHIAERCPKKKNNISEDKYRGKKDDSNKGNKDMWKKAYYIVEEESNDEFNDHDDEVVYVAIKDYKEKGKKSCYIAEEETKDGSDDHDDEVVYVVVKDESKDHNDELSMFL